MVLTEFDEKQFVEDLQKEAYDSGYDSGIDKVNALNRILFTQKRYADLERSANDPKYQALDNRLSILFLIHTAVLWHHNRNRLVPL